MPKKGITRKGSASQPLLFNYRSDRCVQYCPEHERRCTLDDHTVGWHNCPGDIWAHHFHLDKAVAS